MKRNLLKQSVIAVLVGGALSASAFAAVSDSDFNTVKNKVGKHSTTLTNHTDRLKNLKNKVDKHSTTLTNHTDRLKNLRNDVDLNKTNIEKKADKTDVDVNKADIEKFGNQTNANTALLLRMAGKVDQNKKDTDAEIAKKANQTDVDA
ncbi:hypothetical protein CH605_004965, partial [Haemophilus influenzae]|nr:hypothetical protein [Haemophilus influenzae]